jgi:hypothetical protein
LIASAARPTGTPQVQQGITASCGLEQAHAPDAVDLPAGGRLRLLVAGHFHTKLRGGSEHHLAAPDICLRILSAKAIDRGTPLNATRARQPVNRRLLGWRGFARDVGIEAAVPLLHQGSDVVMWRLHVAGNRKRIERVKGPRTFEQVPIFIAGKIVEPADRLDLE